MNIEKRGTIMNNALIRIILAMMLVFVPVSSIGAEIHVPLDQPTIQAGINAAVDGDTVVVADGTWSGAGNVELDFGGRNITVRSANGPAGCTIDCAAMGRAFTFHSGESREALVQGFTIINGGAAGGGAIDIDVADPSIIGNVFEDNLDSAIDTLDGGPLIHGNVFNDNAAPYGGSIMCDGGHGFWFYADIRNNEFNGSTALAGGAIYVVQSHPLIIGNTFTGNHVSGGIYSSSGGAVFVGSDSVPEIIGNSFIGNTAETYGGAVFVVNRSNDPYIASNVFEDNSAEQGGAVAAYHYALPRIVNNLFLANQAADIGGAVASIFHAEPTLVNNTMVGNSAVTGGGAVSAERQAEITLENCILYDNLAPAGGGPQMGVRNDSTITIGYSLVEGGAPGVFVSPNSTLAWGTAMINADPQFVSGAQGDHYLSQVAAGQGSDSPGLDAGGDTATAVGYVSEEVTVTLDQLTTRTDRVSDGGVVDLGYHYPAVAVQTVTADLQCSPPMGVLPFTTNIAVTMTNEDDMITRRMAGEIDLQPAAGGFINRWKAGFGNVGPGGQLAVSWNQNIPNLATLVGDNVFTLQAEDVTPAPYNQPPYFPSGDTDSSNCTVGGIAP